MLLLIALLLASATPHVSAGYQTTMLISPTENGSSWTSASPTGHDNTALDHVDPTDATSGPSLTLDWPDTNVHVGVPITLSIQALDASGQHDPQEGTVALDVQDPRAEILGFAGTATVRGQQFLIPISAGQVTIEMRFATPGAYTLFATLNVDTETTGQSATLHVHDVFISLERAGGSPAADDAAMQRYIVEITDDQGQLVKEYAGTVVVSTGDPSAIASGASTKHEDAPGIIAYEFAPHDGGRVEIELTFGEPGQHDVNVHDAVDPTRESVVDASTGADTTSDEVSFSGGARSLSSVTPSFDVSISSVSTNAGVELQMTVTALDTSGNVDTGYRGQVKLTSTDTAFVPGTAYRYTFTAGDNGTHVFPVRFHTVGTAQTITVIDTASSSMTGTSPSVDVAETVFVATFASGTVQQGTSVNLTVQAQTSGGSTLAGFRGTVLLSSTWNGVTWFNWGAGVGGSSSYTFTATDAGTHVFTPKFSYAGEQTATITDQKLPARFVTTSAITVTNTVATNYPHSSAPAGIKLSDGSYLYAFLGIRGRIYTRRNVGSFQDPVWQPTRLVRDVTGGTAVGADAPTLVRLGTTLALFHTYTDGTYFQVWLMTSTDDGDTWSTPTQLTSDAGHVQRIQTVMDGGTLHVFWSRQDTSQQLRYRTSTDLTNWSAAATVGQAIGVPVLNTTSNFGIAKTAAGSWILGWLWPSAVNELGTAGNYSYPTVRVATSNDLDQCNRAQSPVLRAWRGQCRAGAEPG